jgi:hypothetical protein
MPTYIDKVMRLGGERNTHKQAYSPECVEEGFSEVGRKENERLSAVLASLPA